MVRVGRVRYRRWPQWIEWIQRIKRIRSIIRSRIDNSIVLTIPTLGYNVFDDQMRQSWTAAVKAGYCSAESGRAGGPHAIGKWHTTEY
jgi:hypothetical protein